jgi:hypothetical protein
MHQKRRKSTEIKKTALTLFGPVGVFVLSFSFPRYYYVLVGAAAGVDVDVKNKLVTFLPTALRPRATLAPRQSRRTTPRPQATHHVLPRRV